MAPRTRTSRRMLKYGLCHGITNGVLLSIDALYQARLKDVIELPSPRDRCGPIDGKEYTRDLALQLGLVSGRR